MPDTPKHTFIGCSRELLALERLLSPFDSAQGMHSNSTQGYAVIKGQGGIGKTTIAVELTLWLVQAL